MSHISSSGHRRKGSPLWKRGARGDLSAPGPRHTLRSRHGFAGAKRQIPFHPSFPRAEAPRRPAGLQKATLRVGISSFKGQILGEARAARHFVILVVLLLHAACPRATAASEPKNDGASIEKAVIPAEHLDRIVDLFNQGIALMERFEPVAAVKAFEEVVKLAPDWTTGRLNYGIALLNAQTDEHYAQAEIELKKVIVQAPRDPTAHYALGMLLRHLGRFDEARNEFQRVLEIDPDDGDALYQLGSLLMEDDPEAARRHFEMALEIIPHHESACYRLHSLLMKAGETDRARALLQRFQALKAAKAGVFSGMKYGEMGRYASVIRAFPERAAEQRPGGVPSFRDEAESFALRASAGGTAGWPGESVERGAGGFAPAVAVEDVDGDEDLDLYITGVAGGRGVLYRHEGREFSPAAETGIDAADAIGAYFGDYDGDGDPDLYLTRPGPNRLYRNEGGSKFVDVTEATGTAGGAFVSVGAAWADADHDGDLDLYVANFAAWPADPASSAGAPNALFRNNGDGTFSDVAGTAQIDGGAAATTSVLFFDFDADRDLDLYLVNHRSPNRVFLNDRVGRYTDATGRHPELADAGPGTGALAGDLDLDGRMDLLLLRGSEPPRLFPQRTPGHYSEDSRFTTLASAWGGAVGGLMGDLDLDGDLDLVFVGTGPPAEGKHQVLINEGDGRFAPAIALGAARREPDARGALAVDLDRDGALEVLVARAGGEPELWRSAPSGRHWLEVVPARSTEAGGRWIESNVIGLEVEVKTGRRMQVATLTGSTGYLGSGPRRLHFGLGEHAKADYVRFVWPDAVLQSELEVAADQSWWMTKVVRKPSSCPVLFAWDGERFAFVTDFLGVGGLGFFVSPGSYAPPDPTEDVRIPPELIRPDRGRYLMRIAEPLEEVVYLDELHLHVYDHPEEWEIYPDERLTGTPPFPSGRPLAVAGKVFPVSARNDRGDDVLDRVLDVDRRYVDVPKDPRFVGYADDHWIELDFGDRLQGIEPDARLVLYLYGWVEYTYSHVNYAAFQAGMSMRPPAIEVPDGQGGWRVAVAEAGYPAGLPRMMTLDVSSLPVRTDGRLRIRTNMEIFWDQIFVGEDVAGARLREHALRPAVAELRYLGYPREYSPDGLNPTLYDYHRIDQGVPFKNLSGAYTRFGDVRPLLEAADDRFVIMGRGEEIALEFDATELPALPAGDGRTLVLHTDGYCKDMDLYTAFPHTVDPLPYHGMENYPPPPQPRSEAQELYDRTWNVRHVKGG